jgi:hypothetical protein
MNKPAQPAPQADPRTPSDMLVNGGALTLALNVLRRAGKDEVADELEKTAVSACSASVSTIASDWYEGEPPFPQNQEWFIAETTHKDKVVLMALPEEHSYDYTTADGTHLKAGMIKRWMQFPDCEYLPPQNVDTPPPPDVSTNEQVSAAPPCWWINHESHGQITQCHKEAARAAADGKVVIEYASKPMVAYQQNNNGLSPTDDEIIDMAVEPLGIDYDRMPYGIVVFARTLLSRYAVLVRYPALDTEQATEAEWFECEGQVFHKDSPDMNDWIRWKGTPLYRHPAYAQALRKKNKELWDALSIAKNTITDARNDLIACHSIKGVIPADDVEGLAGVVEYDSILKPINAALSEIPEVPATHVVAQEQPDIQLQLKDPVVVHTNMCRGIIAPITFDMLAHVLGDDAKQEWLAAQAQQVDLIRFDYVNADGQPDSKMLTHDEMRERYAEQSQNAYQSPAASQQPVSGERPCLLDALSAIEWLERRVPQSYKNSEGNVACVVNAKESLRRLLATPQSAGNAAQTPSVPTLSAETLRVCGIIADRIENGSLFRAGIYKNSTLAAFVRQLISSASGTQAHKDINETMKAWRSDDVDLHAALATEFSKHPQTKAVVGREALVLRCLRAAIEAV